MIKETKGFFEKVYFSESTFGKFFFNGSKFVIPVFGFSLLGDHPLKEIGYGPHNGEFIFNDVISSSRTIYEKIGDPRGLDGFKPPFKVNDEIPIKILDDSSFQYFCFEGFQESPHAWIDNWVVRAKSFTLIID